MGRLNINQKTAEALISFKNVSKSFGATKALINCNIDFKKSAYFEDYLFHIDNDDKIHGILGKQRYRNLEICKSVAEDLKKIVE